MPKIDLVDVMKKPPGQCGICNTSPSGVDGKLLKAIDTNVDVDWGNNLYICSECVNVISDLFDRVTTEEHQRVVNELKDLTARHRRLRRRYKDLEERAGKMASGIEAATTTRARKKRRAA